MTAAIETKSRLRIGPYPVDPPVVLAPMAGITNVAFRTLCREFGSATSIYVCEMITARAVVERNEKTLHMMSFGPEEKPRSMQLYGVDPATIGEAVRVIVGEGWADHIDLNLGCPVPKVTRLGGGAALPYKRRLFEAIVRAMVSAAEPAGIPITVKFRIGIDDEHTTYLDAGRIAEAEGAAAVALHARTAAQRYSGEADWSAIARLKQAVTTIPVLGNGDIFAAADAVAMMSETGCDGVVVGRGCLGRPWLFAELQAALRGEPVPAGPDLGRVGEILYRHAALLADHYGEDRGLRDLRKHMAWYLMGFPVGADLRRRFASVATLTELQDLIGELDPTAPFPPDAEGPRGRQGSPGKVSLPHGWLDDPEDAAVPTAADVMHSGG
ncbi:tRNA dihydrouridine synthase DusB [Nocardia terpenica]|uniref:tRNA dihydrouridine synthase DusB n=1 Tax=Nocardia terpenica TaxID=455432 RepID=UPI0015C55AAE|nr:tRNA dihydrouridine synthase DusB [Nocardia terpenica]MBF6062249.1 tRNA dihydrouridine synthase DusB [Nocardia terpenica]MBF6104337.1 tRNA dihydrouridine synthase DusB [Nocardia terpenica]MBF6109807.1 tRNA dihydrouridine synthase DusB [Nocardia terpenica]MBF6120113.1 tRNA dihydrouridine synthase DusB [Nocardia terpenica]MBF6152524.1 tRNA dihydrouridine synthase DusB [Nocardia terpenica]